MKGKSCLGSHSFIEEKEQNRDSLDKALVPDLARPETLSPTSYSITMLHMLCMYARNCNWRAQQAIYNSEYVIGYALQIRVQDETYNVY